MPAFQIIVVVAMPIAGPEAGPNGGRCTLELKVCVDSVGRLVPTFADVGTPHCRLLSDGEEVWSGRLGRDCGEWVIHSSMGDDEPLRRLRATTLRPGDHLTLGCPREGDVEFRVVQASRAVVILDR